MKKYFTRQELLETIIDHLQSYSGYYGDLHNEIFNTGYYIVSTSEAKEALEEYDAFAAVGKVYMYERDNFGEVYTDLSDPVKVANMLWYVLGEELMWEFGLFEYDGGYADEETNRKLIERLESELEDE